MAWGTTADLLSAVRLRAMRPDASADGAITDAEILGLADEEVAFRMVPLLRSVREEHWVTCEDFTIADYSDRRFRIPGRAQAAGLRDVTLRDTSSGTEWSIPRLTLEDIGSAEVGGSPYGDRRAFVLEGNEIVLLPTTGNGYPGDVLRVRYERRHPLLVETTAATQADVSGSSGAWGLTPSSSGTWSTTLNGAVTVDLYRFEPQFGAYAVDATIDAINGGSTDTETTTTTANLTGQSGLWVSLPDTSPVVILPYECWPLLVSYVTGRVLEAVGDREGAAFALQRAEQERQNVLTLLEPRVEGELPRIINTSSHLRGGGWWRW